MGFFLNGETIGHGTLDRVSIGKKRKWVHTEATEIYRKFRRKGHGIHLYIALVETARAIGATRIQSSRSLNRYSRRMWQEKLAKVYPVKMSKSNRPCRRCGHKPSWNFFYINLEK